VSPLNRLRGTGEQRILSSQSHRAHG